MKNCTVIARQDPPDAWVSTPVGQGQIITDGGWLIGSDVDAAVFPAAPRIRIAQVDPEIDRGLEGEQAGYPAESRCFSCHLASLVIIKARTGSVSSRIASLSIAVLNHSRASPVFPMSR